MSSPSSTYTDPQEHLSQNQLMRYGQGNMTDAEMHRVERHLLECDLCNDAVEGLALLYPRQGESALRDVKERFNTRQAHETEPAKLYWKWGIAASVLLVAGTVFFLLNRSLNLQEQQNRELVQQAPEINSERPPYLSYTEEKEKKTEIKPESTAVQAQEKAANHSPGSKRVRKKMPPPPQQAMEEPEKPEETALHPPEGPSAADTDDAVATDPVVLEEIEFDSEHSMAETRQHKDSMADQALVAQPSDSPARDRHAGAKKLQPSYDPKIGMGSAERKILRGKVTDPSGEPLPGANVRLVGSNKTVVTNFLGEYSLELPVVDTAVQIGFIGYETKRVVVPDSTTQLLAVLDEDAASLNEVVVRGYAQKQKREMTGAVNAVEIVPPKPVEGKRAYEKYLDQNRRYTSEAEAARIEGSVVLEFYVDKDSTLSNFQVRKSLGHGLDEEAIRLVKEGPAWQPAVSGKQPVGHKARVWVRFKLDE